MSRAALKDAQKRARELTAEQDRALFYRLLTRQGLPLPLHEHRFASPRLWRLDYAWCEHMVALEVEGGIWTNGRHTRGAGFLEDIAKYNRAAVLGWRLLRCTPAGLTDLWTITQLADALAHSTPAPQTAPRSRDREAAG